MWRRKRKLKEKTRNEIIEWLRKEIPYPEKEKEKLWEDVILERIEEGLKLILRVLLEAKEL